MAQLLTYTNAYASEQIVAADNKAEVKAGATAGVQTLGLYLCLLISIIKHTCARACMDMMVRSAM